MIARATAAFVRLCTGVRRVESAPHGEGPAIYYANHSSHLDFVVIWAALPAAARAQLSPAAAEDYWARGPIRRRIACDLFKAVLIPREGISRTNNPVERMAACLESGRSVLIFPEGTRRTDGEVGQFKPGLWHLARRFPRIPLVPVYLENLNRVFPRGTFVPVPLIAQATFLPPQEFSADEPRETFLLRTRAALLPASETTAPSA